MSRESPKVDLDTRHREILKAIIATYVLDAEPVSSRAVAKQGGLGLSAATIRNVMADLEDWGFLIQPHTSAGRVPTGEAYHLFIDSMMSGRGVPARHRRFVHEHLKASSEDPEELMAATSHVLSELTQQVGIVVGPALGEAVLEAINFVPMSGRKVLCVVVSAAGFVDNKVIETSEPIAGEKLVEISNYLNANFSGVSMQEIRSRILALMNEERAQMDRMLSTAIELAREGLRVRSVPEVRVDGASTVLGQPELADLERVRTLMETFADRVRLVDMLNRCMSGTGLRVLIGADSDLTSPLDFSLVATTYRVGDRPLGTLGVFGPSRMAYQRIIPLVDYVGESLSRALDEGVESKVRDSS
ncbi:MAG: heat-inducible transcriptional repressor HrcA [Acidobacteriota bacterium]